MCVFLAVLLFTASGCTEKNTSEAEEILLGEWLQEIREQAGFDEKDAVKAAENWEILPPAYDVNAPVDRETAAYVLAHLYSTAVQGNAEFTDREMCEWKEEIEFMLENGWMRTNKKGAFCPKERITPAEAQEMLSAVVWAMNHREFVPHASVHWKDGKEPEDLSGAVLDEESMTASVMDPENLEDGQLVRIGNMLFRVEARDTEKNAVKLKEADLLEEADMIDVQGEYDADFSQAEIEAEGEEIMPSGAGFASPRIAPYTKTLDVRGFRVTISVSPAGIRAEASRTLTHGSRFTAALFLNGIRCSYAWKEKDSSASYLRIQCNTIEKTSLRNGTSQNLYSDFSKFDRKDIPGSLKNMFAEKKDVLEGSLTLCTVTLPLPEAPGVSLKTSIELHMYASGRMELTLTQKHTVGFEMRNGNVRLIHDTEKSADAVVRANTSLTAGIRFALVMYKAELMDAFLEAGAEAVFAVTMHKYEKDGTVHSEQTDADPELAEAYASQDPSWQVCTDMHANWLLNIRLNSSKTAAGKLGLSRSFAVLSAANAPLFSLPRLHLEHFQPVASCTVKDAVVMRTMDPVDIADTIELASYSIEVRKGSTERIAVTALPEEYGMEDLIFRSSAPETASAEGNGEIRGLHGGAAYIIIETYDRKYRVLCHVMVTDPLT